MQSTNVIPFPVGGKQAASPSTQSQPQSSERPFNVIPFLPQGCFPALREQGEGVLRIPHSVLEFIVKTTDTKAEFAVFTCLVRWSLGFGRSSCKCSLSYISKWTGLGCTTVRRGLDGLTQKNLISEVAAGTTSQESTLWSIPIVSGYLIWLRNQALADAKKQELHSKQVEYSTQNEHSHSQNEYGSPLKIGTKKENTKKDLKKTLHTLNISNLPETLKRYFDSLRPMQRREREWKHFQLLKEAYSISEIALAVESLLESGLPRSGEVCRAPMAFLGQSMPVVLEEIGKEVSASEREANVRSAEQARKEAKDAEERREIELFEQTERKFLEAFPTADLQADFFQRFKLKFPIYGTGPLILRNSAICYWGSNGDNLNQI